MKGGKRREEREERRKEKEDKKRRKRRRKEKRKKEKEKKQFYIPAFPNAEIQFLLKNSGCILVLKKDILCFQLK